MQTEVSSSSGWPSEIRFTDRPVSGWGGLAFVGRFFESLGVPELLTRALPDGRTSPNQSSIRDIASSLFSTILTGGSRFSHVERLRNDEVVRTAMGMERVVSTSTLTRYFGGFTQADVEHLTEVLWPLWTETACVADGGGVLDLDSTIIERFGGQEGSLKGHNPRRHGRPSHHPLLAMLADSKQIANAWLRSGNSGTARGVNEFLTETLARLPEHLRIRAIRADSGFFIASFLDRLEEMDVSYAIAARTTHHLRRSVLQITNWRSFGEGYEVAEMPYSTPSWKTSRRLVVIREELAERPDARGRRLFEIPLYAFHFVITNLDLVPEEVWRFYNQRAECENRLKELKNDYGASGFCLESFFGTEAVFRLNCLLFNLMARFKAEIGGDSRPQLATVRNHLLVVGAIRGSSGRRTILHIGARARHRQLLEAVLARLDGFRATAMQLMKRLPDVPISEPRKWKLRAPPVLPVRLRARQAV